MSKEPGKNAREERRLKKVSESSITFQLEQSIHDRPTEEEIEYLKRISLMRR